jgi:acyl-CoA synthetase (AMP-forming)/AMP-acid ligase II
VNYHEIDAVVAALTAPDGQFPVLEQDIGGHRRKVFGGLPENLRDYYGYTATFGDKDCLVSGERRYSFNEVLRQLSHLAAALRDDYGVRPGDRVAIAMRNCPEWCISFMAVTALGAVAVPMNSWWLGEELAFGLEDSGARLLIADGPRCAHLAVWLADSRLPVIGVETGGPELPEGIGRMADILGRPGAVAFPDSAAGPDDPAVILYTSGSTGHPKGVLSTQRNVISAIGTWLVVGTAVAVLNGTVGQEPESQPGILLTVPLFHVTGLNSLFLLSLLIGRKIVMMRKWDVDKALELIQAEKISHFNGVPTMSMELIRHPQLADYDLSSLVEVASGGAACPGDHVARIVETLPGALPSAGYGLTETNAVGCLIGQDDYLRRPSSVGRPIPPLTELQITGPDGARLPAGEVGEIWIRSPAVPAGYWNLEEDTRRTFTDGWCHTGDVGYLDEDGFVFIVDRLKDIIIRGGENISCLEVEEALYSHPEVAEAAVFGLPDERLGETVAAVVATADGRPIGTEALCDWLAGRLAAFKVPQRIVCHEGPMPRIASGKIAKRQLREAMLASLAGKE